MVDDADTVLCMALVKELAAAAGLTPPEYLQRAVDNLRAAHALDDARRLNPPPDQIEWGIFADQAEDEGWCARRSQCRRPADCEKTKMCQSPPEQGYGNG